MSKPFFSKATDKSRQECLVYIRKIVTRTFIDYREIPDFKLQLIYGALLELKQDGKRISSTGGNQ